METHMIACEMLRDELELAMEHTGIRPPVVWIEKGLHDAPQKLHEVLQNQILKVPEDCRQILLAMAYCGGAVEGLVSDTASLAIPRFDDCVRMFLSRVPGQWNGADLRTLYFTRQWIESDRYLLQDLDRYNRRYGEKRAKAMQRAMLSHYRSYCLIDTGAFDVTALESAARRDAARLELSFSTQPGSVRILEKLLRQSFDEEFYVTAPGQKLNWEQLLGQRNRRD